MAGRPQGRRGPGDQDHRPCRRTARFSRLLAALWPGARGGLTTTTSYSTTPETEDHLAILELIGRYVLVLDGRDWDALGELFADTVYSDRTSLLGGEPVTVGRAEFVAGWRQTLQNLDAVHHMITCHVISLDGDRATCAANMQGTHVYTNHSGGPIWTVGGRHD